MTGYYIKPTERPGHYVAKAKRADVRRDLHECRVVSQRVSKAVRHLKAMT